MEYLEFAAELKGIPKQQRESAIDEVIQMAKLEDVKMRLIRNLSKDTGREWGLHRQSSDFRRSSFWMNRQSVWIRSRSLRSVS